MGDGLCNSGNNTNHNTDLCNWDGGDCCALTCDDGEYNCGYTANGNYVGFNQCLEPDVCDVRDPSVLGDGSCTAPYNTDLCNWDGGDCCERTCVSTDDNECAGEFPNCLDPASQPINLCRAPNQNLVGDGICQPGTLFNNGNCSWE